MIETTYNGSHNFLIFLPHSPSPLFSPQPPPLRSHVPIVWIHHRSLFNAILARCSCQRGSGSLEAPWSDTKSAKRRKRVGRRTRRRRKVGESGGKGSGAFPPPHQLEIILSCVIFSPSHIYLKISVDLHHNILNHRLTC